MILLLSIPILTLTPILNVNIYKIKNLLFMTLIHIMKYLQNFDHIL